MVDDRPALERELDNFASSKWKKIVGSFTHECKIYLIFCLINLHSANEASVSQVDNYPRRRRHDSSSSSDAADLSKTKISQPKIRHDSDGGSDADLSPPRTLDKKNLDVDLSPPRKLKNNEDLRSPKRKTAKDDDLSPIRRNEDDDLSPPRLNQNRTRRDSDDLSPPRSSKSKQKRSKSPEISSGRSRNSRYHGREKRTRSRSRERLISRDGDRRPIKTLAGAKAGLQTAADMRREADELKKKEDETFRKVVELVNEILFSDPN